MSSQSQTLEAARDGIISAIAEMRAVARVEHDKQRNRTPDWLDEPFARYLFHTCIIARAITLGGNLRKS
jgi:hypothetical protein